MADGDDPPPTPDLAPVPVPGGRHTALVPSWSVREAPAGVVAGVLTATAFAVAEAAGAGVVAVLMLGTLAVVAALGVFFLITRPPELPWLRRKRVRATVGVLVAATAVTVAMVAIPEVAESRETPCEPPLELRAVAAPSQAATAAELAATYEGWTAAQRNGCASVNIFVYQSDQAAEALGQGWTIDDVRDVGPTPDLWFPESREQVAGVEERTRSTSNLSSVLPHEVASSPLVVAGAASTIAGAAPRWASLADTVADLDWQPARPDPTESAVGRLVTTATYGSAPTDEEAVHHARPLERAIETTLDQGGYPLSGGEEALLCHHRRRGGDAGGTTLLISEQAMVRFNHGDLLDGRCPGPADRARSTTTSGCRAAAHLLLALYPADTLAVEFVVAELAWRDRTAERAEAVGEVVSWFSDPAGQDALRAAGLRPAGASANGEGSLVSRECGAEPDPLPGDLVPTPGALAQAERAYHQAQRPGRVLLALDTSGSMEERVTADQTRYEVAEAAINEALQQLGGRDEFGLWVISDYHPREQVAIGPADDGSRAAAATAALDSLSPRGWTPLHRTIVDGVDEVGGPASGDPDPDGDPDTPDDPDDPDSQDDGGGGQDGQRQVQAMVVVTDGEDTDRDPRVDAALAAIDAASGVRVYVIAVGEASCELEAIGGVTRRTGGECVQADFGELPAQLSRLFGVLWSGDLQ